MSLLSTEDCERVDEVLSTKTAEFPDLLKIANLDPACDLLFADLRNVEFGAHDYGGYDFSGADLRGANFSLASIEGCGFLEQPDRRDNAISHRSRQDQG